MKLIEIYELLRRYGLHRDNCKDAARKWLRERVDDYSVMGTLTLRQSWYNKNGRMRIQHYLSADDIPKIYERFEHKLNVLIFKHAYSRHGSRRLNFFRVWEDGHGTKRKHLHFLIGGLPSGFKLNTLPMLVEKAARQCYEIDVEHKETVTDAEVVDYITKEVGKKDTDKILW